MLVGPLLAAGLVAATWWVAREIAASAGENGARTEGVARVAAGLSLVSAALRYHTADVLPYGAAAVALTVTTACALRGRRKGAPRLFAAAGLALGLLLATRPTSGVAAGAITLALATGSAHRARAVACSCIAALPGLGLLLAANHAATGHALSSPFVQYLAAVTPSAATHSGAGAAILRSLRGLRAHLADVTNFEPLALVAAVPLFGRTRARAAVLAALIIAGEIACQLPLSEDGGRALVDVLPLEHALIALGIAQIFPGALASAATATLALALGGFALHASHDHERIATGDLGHPHFEPDVAREGGVTHGLLFFEDDRGYELAQDPGVLASHGIEAARMRGDDHDRLLYDLLGHPPTHRYVADGASGSSVTLWSPPVEGSGSWRFEAESDWPPVATVGGWAQTVDAPGSCASDGRALALTPRGGAEARTTIELPVPRGALPAERRAWMVTPRAFRRGEGGTATLELVISLGGAALAHWSWTDAGSGVSCLDLTGQSVELGGDRSRGWLILTARGGPVALDRTVVGSP
jgi:hypothetical protein